MKTFEDFIYIILENFHGEAIRELEFEITVDVSYEPPNVIDGYTESAGGYEATFSGCDLVARDIDTEEMFSFGPQIVPFLLEKFNPSKYETQAKAHDKRDKAIAAAERKENWSEPSEVWWQFAGK